MHDRIPKMHQYRVELEILTPVHIGTGHDLDPFSYVIQDDRLYFIDLTRWMEAYPDKSMLNRMFESENFAAVRTFIAQNVSAKEYGLASVPVGSQELIQTYKRAIDKQDPRNQVLISPTIRNDVNMQALIPGSSIKGAIRTALGNRCVEAAGVTSKDARRAGGNPDYNEKIFGRIRSDPMRWLKVSDVPLGVHATAIVEAVEHAKNPGKKPTPKGYYEVIHGLAGKDKSITYPINISLAPFQLWNENITTESIIEALYSFYVPKYLDEFAKFYRDTAIEKGLKPVNEIIDNMKTNETILRVGHFSHVECVTLDGVRNPRTRRGRDGRPLPYGTTRTLADGFYPFGWIKLRFPDIAGEVRKSIQWSINGRIEQKAIKPAANVRRKIVDHGIQRSKEVDLSGLKQKFTIKKKS
jgi:CRISPR type III-A-associated RAMP protein Csm5